MSGLSVYLPGLAGPIVGGQVLESVQRSMLLHDDEATDMAALFRRARFEPSRFRGRTLEAQIGAAFGMGGTSTCSTSSWPVAALMYHFDVGQPAGCWCMRADPVHMRPDPRDIHLTPARELSLTDSQAGQLISELNQHFADAPWYFVAGKAGRWYLLSSEPLDVRTSPPPRSAARRLDSLMATGPDGQRLHVLMNEAQMVLHASSVNAERATAGHAPINGVWCWGESTAQADVGLAEAPWSTVWSDDSMIDALAAAGRAATGPIAGLRPGLEDFSGGAFARGALVASTEGYTLAQSADLDGWRTWFLSAMEHVLRPAAAALLAGRLRHVALSWGGESACVLRPGDRWKLWRRGPDLRDLIHSAPSGDGI